MRHSEPQRVRPLAFLLGLLFAAALGLTIPYTDMFLKASRLAYCHLPIAPLFILLVLVGAYNRLAARVNPAFALTPTEALLIYAVLLAVVTMSSAGYGAWAVTVPTASFYYANPGNKWEELFWGFIPKWTRPDPNSGAVTGLYEGLHRAQSIPWHEWRVPLFAWTLFAFLFLATWLCWGLLLRGRWMESEKLLFPLAEVPLALVGNNRQAGPGSIMASRLFWLGLALPAFFHSFNSINYFVPVVPRLQIHDINIGEPFVRRPWSELSDLRIYILFAVIGIAFLVTSEISLGLWFWFWFVRAERILFSALGITTEQRPWLVGMDPARWQEVGAFFALVGFLLWTSRGELWARLKRALAVGWLRREHGSDPLPFTLALIGFLVSFCGLVLWCVAGGAGVGASVLFFLIFLVTETAMARLVNAGGVMFVEASFMPQDVIAASVGTARVGARSLTVFAPIGMMFFFEQQGILMPYLMDSLRIGRAGGVKGGTYLAAVLLAFLALIGPCCYMLLRLGYTRGGHALDNWYWVEGARWPWDFLASQINSPTNTSWGAMGISAAGGVFMVLLLAAQRRFVWWPIHPLGFLMGTTYTMGVMWFSWLTGWLTKVTVQRYGGFSLYRRLRPFFLGMVVGELAIAAVWLAIDAAAGVTGHNLFPAF